MREKTERMKKLEDKYQSTGGPYLNFDWMGDWSVTLDGSFTEKEIREIANTLKAANKKQVRSLQPSLGLDQ